MTERLSALLHEEAARLDVPLAPAVRTIETGRRLRRRRRFAQTGATVAVVAVLGVGAAMLSGGTDRDAGRVDGTVADGGQTATTTSGSPGVPVDLGAVFASGDTVYVDDGTTPVKMAEVAQTMYYTSAGLLVRTNKDGASDGGAPFHFELIGADGSVSKLDLTLGEVVPSTDPRQPYLAYAQAADNVIQVVVHDVATDRDVARVDVPEQSDWGGWEAPPVSLDGDLVYVATSHETLVVNWRTGAVSTSDVLTPRDTVEVRGGHAIVWQGKYNRTVVDVGTGTGLLNLAAGDKPTFDQLSPDGRYLFRAGMMSRATTTIYDVDTGKSVEVQGVASGWTADDQVVLVFDVGVITCAPTTGACADPLRWPPGFSTDSLVRVAGRSYES